MSFRQIRYIAYSWLLYSTTSMAVCPDWLKTRSADIPTCPAGSTIPETYPTGAVVVSDRGVKGQDSSFTTDFVEKVLMGAGPNTPMVLLPVSDETMAKIYQRISSLPVSEKQKTVFRNAIVHVPAKPYTWQQDYFQSFVDPASGQPVLRPVDGYDRADGSLDQIVAQAAECGFSKGPPLVAFPFVNGAMGGNVQMLPSGVCALGEDGFVNDQHWSNYADQFCGKDPKNRLKVPTSWLKVGHTDEIMKTVRNKNQPAPCDFSIVVASPRKALELLKTDPDGHFLDFSAKASESATAVTIRRTREYEGLSQLCLAKANLGSPSIKPTTPAAPTKKVTQLIDLFWWPAHADPNPYYGTDCANMTNGDVLRVLTSDSDSDLKRYNELVQQEMDNLKRDVAERMKEKFPNCNIDIVDTPDLFFGGHVVKGPNGDELPHQRGDSILPNPANAVSVNDTVISPDPSNAVFKKYIQNLYASKGLKSEFVDTFDYAHQGDGNLHCSTHTIQICNPRGKQ